MRIRRAPDHEGAALTRAGARRRDPSSVQFHQAADEGQADAEAALRAIERALPLDE